MRRFLLAVSLLGSAMSIAGCSEAFLGVVGEHVYSSHQDGGVVGGTRQFNAHAPAPNVSPVTAHAPATTQTQFHGLETSLVGEFRFEKEWDASYAAHILGGVRLQNNTRFKWPYFYEVTGGLTHYPGENLFTLHPNIGFIIPRSNPNFQYMVRLGLPVYFFSGNTEVGTEFTFAINLPHPRK